MEDRAIEVTQLLREGAPAGDRLMPLIYDELRVIARRRMGAERPDHTLQATALVNEAYLKLVGQEKLEWQSRRHFYGAASEAMRRILIDHARKAKSQKRGGDVQHVTLGAPEAPMVVDPDRLLALDDALEKLAAEDAEAAEVTRLRFFAGLSVQETAEAVGISERTAARKWTYARARLTELLSEDEA